MSYLVDFYKFFYFDFLIGMRRNEYILFKKNRNGVKILFLMKLFFYFNLFNI